MIVRSKAYRRFVAARLDVITICVSIAVAAFFLFHRIGNVPPLFPWSDESEIAADAMQTLALGPQLVYPNQLAGGSLAVYLETVFIALFGTSLLGLRILNALLNISLVAMTYVLARRMFVSLGEIIVNFGLSLHRSLVSQTDSSVLDPLTGLLFIVGVVAAIARLRQRAQLFLLIWWGTLVLPAALSSASEGFELMRQGVGAEPVTFMFPAVGLATIGQWVRSRYPRFISIAGPALAKFLVAFSAVTSYEYYFWDWATGADIPQLFAEKPVRFIEWLKAQATPDMVYIFPMRPGASPTTRPELFTVRYLYDGQAPIAYPVLDETTLAATLTALSADKSIVKLIVPERYDTDPKGYLDFLLQQHARDMHNESRFGYVIKTYWLKSSSEKFEARGPVVAANIDFGRVIRLVDYSARSAALLAGQRLWVTIQWTKSLDTAQDYSAGLALVDGDGYAIAQTDKLRLSDTLNQGTSHWAIGETAADYYVLDIPTYAPPGDYALDVVVYSSNGERLMPSGGRVDLSLRLVEVKVTPSALPVDPAGLAIKNPVDKPVTPALRIAGMDLSQTVVQPGSRADLTLMWQAIDAPQQNYELIVGLTGEDGLVYATGPRPLVSASYPTTRWRRGEVLQAHYTLLPPTHLESV